MRFCPSRKNLSCYLVPGLAAIAVRIMLFVSWLNSPLSEYHHIRGLDMIKYPRGFELFWRASRPFSIHDLICGGAWKIGGINAMVILQLALGVASTMLIVYITLRLFGNRYAAMLAGMLAGTYAPPMIYELFALKESIFLFMCCVSFAAIAWSRQRHFRPMELMLCGIAIALPCLVRFHGLLWTLAGAVWIMAYLRKKEIHDIRRSRDPQSLGRILIRQYGILWLGIILPFCIAITWNAAAQQRISPFPNTPSFSYIFRVGSETRAETLSPASNANPAIGSKSESTIGSRHPGLLRLATGKITDLIRAYEIPNNLNYYFFRNELKLQPLPWLPGPLLLIPLAITGLLAMLWQRHFGASTVLPIIFSVSIAIPILAFVPLARYRLALLPALCIFAVYPCLFILPFSHDKTKSLILRISMTVIVFLILATLLKPEKMRIRNSDFIAYAQTLHKAGAKQESIGKAYQRAWLIQSDSTSGYHYARFLMENAKFREASRILAECRQSDQDNQRVGILYVGALLGSGEIEQAAAVFRNLPIPESKPAKVNFFYHLGECRRLQGRHEDAHDAYRKAMECTDNQKQRSLIMRAIKAMPTTEKPSEPIETGSSVNNGD